MVFRRSRLSLLLIWILLSQVWISVFVVGVYGDDEFVREVVEEQQRLEEERTRESGHQYEDSFFDEKEEMNRQRQAEEEEKQRRLEEERNERIRQQREAAFEQELQQMNDQQRKDAKKQKKRDSRVVKRVLRASKRQNYYGVLGLRNREMSFRLFGRLFTLFRISSKAIKKAYRNRAIVVHPDKNRDGRAQEAFMAVEGAVSTLLDDDKRAAYDRQRQEERQRQREEVLDLIQTVYQTIHNGVAKVVWVFRKILGPFATPIFILLCLVI